MIFCSSLLDLYFEERTKEIIDDILAFFKVKIYNFRADNVKVNLRHKDTDD